MVAYTVAIVNQDKKSRGRLKLPDFLLRWAPKPRQSQQEQLAIFKALAAATRQETRDDR